MVSGCFTGNDNGDEDKLMKNQIKTSETKGQEQADPKSGSVLERALEAHLKEHDLGRPQMFKLRARLPSQGRGSALLAATDRMWVNLKTYAEGGENTLHGHPNEDHVFIVLQGKAVFFGPEGESVIFSQNEGIMLPRGCTYYFHADESEPLVLLRVGCVYDADKTPWGRVDRVGKPLLAVSKENQAVETIFSDEYYE
jgi:mannose-6-phosphate isomerase-like protein (cupin superfamily)